MLQRHHGPTSEGRNRTIQARRVAALVPFDQLDAEVQAEDQPYVDAIVVVARQLRMGTGSVKESASSAFC
ncbi:DUF7701 domain-containing protein [Mycolicibacterium sp. 22603]|uniref:DUF7701 domain-containing protein n=1 Tax=Mycolicibacterium sp. 22603 TaxID=3453950 RepID=UPI003F8623E1